MIRTDRLRQLADEIVNPHNEMMDFNMAQWYSCAADWCPRIWPDDWTWVSDYPRGYEYPVLEQYVGEGVVKDGELSEKSITGLVRISLGRWFGLDTDNVEELFVWKLPPGQNRRFIKREAVAARIVDFCNMVEHPQAGHFMPKTRSNP